MAITTYAELQAAAANWLVRADLTARIPEFITLAEARLNRVLRARLAEVEQGLSGVVGARTLPLPAGFAEPLALWIVRGTGREALAFIEPSLMAASSLRGEPAAWSVDGANLAFDRPCDQAYGFTLRMLAKFALSDAAPSNALLTDYPDAYLFATLCEAAPFLRDAELSGAYEARLARAIEEINAKDARARAARALTTELTPAFVGARAAY
jgi:hypothetical protein